MADAQAKLIANLNAKNPAVVPTFLQHCGGYGQVTAVYSSCVNIS
jgi:hypothetical protein